MCKTTWSQLIIFYLLYRTSCDSTVYLKYVAFILQEDDDDGLILENHNTSGLSITSDDL